MRVVVDTENDGGHWLCIGVNGNDHPTRLRIRDQVGSIRVILDRNDGMRLILRADLSIVLSGKMIVEYKIATLPTKSPNNRAVFTRDLIYSV